MFDTKQVALGDDRLSVLVVGTHKYRNQPSMLLFADWIVVAMNPLAHVRHCSAPAFFLNSVTCRLSVAKWLFYVDQFVLLPLLLLFRAIGHDRVIVADHSNSFSTILVPRRKLGAMVHDMVGVRLALQGIQDAPAAGASGRVMQRLVLAGLRRIGRLATSANKVARELAAFGISGATVSVGCTLDLRRLSASSEPLTLSARIAGRSFVLNVATDDWRKRKPFLVRTWSALAAAQPDAPILVMAGYTQPDTVTLAEQAGGSVIAANEMSDAELVWLYQHCVATIAASTEEGFCIPILESLYFHKPVLGVRDAAYCEIFGSAIMLFDVASPEKAAAQIHLLLTDPAAQEAALVRRDDLVHRFSFAEFSRRLATAFGTGMSEQGDPSIPRRRALAGTA